MNMTLHGFDTETHAVEFDVMPAPPLVCSSVASPDGAHLLDRTEGLEWFRRVIEDRSAHLVACNLAFDLGVFCALDPTLVPMVFKAIDDGRMHDVAIREALIDIAKGQLVERGDEDDDRGFRYSLALLMQRYFDLDLTAEKTGPDSWRLRYGELANVPIEQWPWAARVYPLRDACFPVAIFKAQEGSPNLHDEQNQVRAAFALHLIRLWGMRTNRERVGELEQKVEAEWQQLRTEFRAIGIFRPDDSKNTKRLAELVTAAYDGSPPETPTGKIATDRDTLLESGDPTLEKLGKAGKNDKRRSTYIPKLKQGLEHPWHPNFNVLVATTRVSSDAQQFPQEGGIRETFEPRPGHCYCSVDYGGLELRTMSQRALWDPDVGFSLMADSLNEGKDVHTMAAATFLGTSYEELLPRIKSKEDLADKFRKLAKVFNFGKGGGMGAGSMAYNARAKDGIRFCLLTGRADRCGVQKELVWVQGKQKGVCSLCIEISRELGYGWLRAWPEQDALFAKARRLTPRGIFVDAEIPGVGDALPVIRGECGYTQWLNTPFQGLGARLVKDAMWRISREMHTDRRSPMWGSHLVLNVHDELVAEMPLERAPEAADRMGLIMRETAKDWLPDLGPSIEADPAISPILSKKMATVRDAAGRLQLWHPEKKAA